MSKPRVSSRRLAGLGLVGSLCACLGSEPARVEPITYRNLELACERAERCRIDLVTMAARVVPSVPAVCPDALIAAAQPLGVTIRPGGTSDMAGGKEAVVRRLAACATTPGDCQAFYACAALGHDPRVCQSRQGGVCDANIHTTCDPLSPDDLFHTEDCGAYGARCTGQPGGAFCGTGRSCGSGAPMRCDQNNLVVCAAGTEAIIPCPAGTACAADATLGRCAPTAAPCVPVRCVSGETRCVTSTEARTLRDSCGSRP